MSLLKDNKIGCVKTVLAGFFFFFKACRKGRYIHDMLHIKSEEWANKFRKGVAKTRNGNGKCIINLNTWIGYTLDKNNVLCTSCWYLPTLNEYLDVIFTVLYSLIYLLWILLNFRNAFSLLMHRTEIRNKHITLWWNLNNKLMFNLSNIMLFHRH